MAAAAQAVAATAAEVRGEAEVATAELQSEDPRWQPLLGLACHLTVDLPLSDFKVADFVRLRVGSILVTHWRLARDVPVRVNGTLVAWAEFEGSGKRLAIRLTELA
jgi:flagellar motor switch/type III secretory pathway protein FliN